MDKTFEDWLHTQVRNIKKADTDTMKMLTQLGYPVSVHNGSIHTIISGCSLIDVILRKEQHDVRLTATMKADHYPVTVTTSCE